MNMKKPEGSDYFVNYRSLVCPKKKLIQKCHSLANSKIEKYFRWFKKLLIVFRLTTAEDQVQPADLWLQEPWKTHPPYPPKMFNAQYWMLKVYTYHGNPRYLKAKMVSYKDTKLLITQSENGLVSILFIKLKTYDKFDPIIIFLQITKTSKRK